MRIASSAKQRTVTGRGGTDRDRADELALRRALPEAVGSSARRRKPVPRVRVDDVPNAAPTRFAHEEADYAADARGSRIRPVGHKKWRGGSLPRVFVEQPRGEAPRRGAVAFQVARAFPSSSVPRSANAAS